MSGFEDVNYYFRKAARVMDLSANVERMLITPYREVKVDVSVTLDNGELGTFIGYRVQHDKSRGPMKGGLRYHPTVDLDEGAGLRGAPARPPPRGRERPPPRVLRHSHGHPPPHTPLPAPDGDPHAQVMAWIM